MKTVTKKLFGALVMLTLLLTIFSGCKKDEDDPVVIPNKTVYELKTKDVLGVSGTVTFTETSSTITTIEIVLTGVSSGSHPAHVHFNSAVEGGNIAITLENVDDTGKSTTVVTQQDDNSAITYAQLIAFDGYVNVHEGATIIAQGDIGGNILTGDKTTYQLSTVGTFGVSGNALFEKRKNGNTLITLTLTGTLAGGDHPSHIHLGSITTAGPIAVTFNNVNGATGKSYTNVKKLDAPDNTPKTYEELLNYTGYINVHLSPTELGTIICQGNIGSNI